MPISSGSLCRIASPGSHSNGMERNMKSASYKRGKTKMVELLAAAAIGAGMTTFFYAVYLVREAIVRGVDDLDDIDWMQ